METGSPYRPRVSRETRLLLTAGLIAIATLWLLARLRFPERPLTPNPIPSVLSQIAKEPNYDDLAGEVAQLQVRLQASLIALDLSPAPGFPQYSVHQAALRLRDDLAVTLVPSGPDQSRADGAGVAARDAASGLAVVRLEIPASTPPPPPWTPRQFQQPRYLAATEIAADRVSLRPAFVGSLTPIESPLWPEPLWAVPAGADLAAGSFLFTTTAEWVGLVITYRGAPAIVPAATVLAEAERLLITPPGSPGEIGIEIQELTFPLASATGASAGVVVAWVGSEGAATQQLTPGDVIEAVDGLPIATREHWDLRMARLSEGDRLTLRVRRQGELKDLALIARARAAPPSSPSLGLSLRPRTKIGAEVVQVERGSAADRAGLAAGDLITQIAEVSAPTPAQVTRAYASMAPGDRAIVAVTRGAAHFVTTVDR